MLWDINSHLFLQSLLTFTLLQACSKALTYPSINQQIPHKAKNALHKFWVASQWKEDDQLPIIPSSTSHMCWRATPLTFADCFKRSRRRPRKECNLLWRSYSPNKPLLGRGLSDLPYRTRNKDNGCSLSYVKHLRIREVFKRPLFRKYRECSLSWCKRSSNENLYTRQNIMMFTLYTMSRSMFGS